MEKLIFDSGVKEYECSSGAVLRFNPTGQNLYARFIEFYEEIPALGVEYDSVLKMDRNIETTEGDSEPNVEFASSILAFDKKVKDKLAYVFGPGNDFDAIFDSVNIMEMTDTGKPALENFLDAIYPVIESNADARKKMQEKVAAAKAKQAANREQRRALAKK